MTLSLFDIAAVLIALTASFAWLNERVVRLPGNIGLLIMGVAASLVLVVLELSFPDVLIFSEMSRLVRNIDFTDTLLNGFLGFLLFAGALHVDLSLLKSRRWPIAIMATLGVFISTAVVAGLLWATASLVGVDLPFIWALVFGALISPTDPVAVLSTLKKVKIGDAAETDIAGESLFNDGVGVVLFSMLLGVAVSHSQDAWSASAVAEIIGLLLLEAGGGGLLGLATGYIAFLAIRSIDEYAIEVLISLALVVGTYSLASALHLSGPIAVVVAGLLIGNRGAAYAMSDTTRRYLFGFWTLIDELLNSVLFMLIGLEVLVIGFRTSDLAIAALAIPIVLLGRLVSVSVPIGMLGRRAGFSWRMAPILTWSGIRGGISVALALSIPVSSHKPTILAATYVVAIFTIVVQGLSLPAVIRQFGNPQRVQDDSSQGIK